MRQLFRLIPFSLVLLFLVALESATVAREPEPYNLHFFIFAGQSNMLVHANYITIPLFFAFLLSVLNVLG